jgi:hypothetical protein
LKKYGFGDLPVYPNTDRKEEDSEPLMSISSREYHLFYDERMTSLVMAITGNFKPQLSHEEYVFMICSVISSSVLPGWYYD